jgi:hypothetical protein
MQKCVSINLREKKFLLHFSSSHSHPPPVTTIYDRVVKISSNAIKFCLSFSQCILSIICQIKIELQQSPLFRMLILGPSLALSFSATLHPLLLVSHYHEKSQCNVYLTFQSNPIARENHIKRL